MMCFCNNFESFHNFINDLLIDWFIKVMSMVNSYGEN